MLTLVLVWAIMGVAWNVFSGYSGLVSFGHASFFGLGAYTVTLLFVEARRHAVDRHPGRHAGRRRRRGRSSAIPTFRLRGVYFALAMLAYPLALLYVFEWLGYQEVALPMKREAPAAYMQFADHRAYVVIALAMLVAAMLVSLRIERSRFGLSLHRDQAERAGGRGRRHRRAGAGRCRRSCSPARSPRPPAASTRSCCSS